MYICIYEYNVFLSHHAYYTMMGKKECRNFLILKGDEVLRRRYPAKIDKMGNGTLFFTDRRIAFISERHGLCFNLHFDNVRMWGRDKKNFYIRWIEPQQEKSGTDTLDMHRYEVKIRIADKKYNGWKLTTVEVAASLLYNFMYHYSHGHPEGEYESQGLYPDRGEDGKIHMFSRYDDTFTWAWDERNRLKRGVLAPDEPVHMHMMTSVMTWFHKMHIMAAIPDDDNGECKKQIEDSGLDVISFKPESNYYELLSGFTREVFIKMPGRYVDGYPVKSPLVPYDCHGLLFHEILRYLAHCAHVDKNELYDDNTGLPFSYEDEKSSAKWIKLWIGWLKMYGENPKRPIYRKNSEELKVKDPERYKEIITTDGGLSLVNVKLPYSGPCGGYVDHLEKVCGKFTYRAYELLSKAYKEGKFKTMRQHMAYYRGMYNAMVEKHQSGKYDDLDTWEPKVVPDDLLDRIEKKLAYARQKLLREEI